MATLVTTAIAVLVTVERANQWTIKNSWLIRSLRRTNDWCQFKPIHSTNWSTIYKHVSITSRPGRYSPSCTRTRVPCRECGKSKLILLSHWLRRRQRRCSRQQRPLLLGSIGEGAPGRGGGLRQRQNGQAVVTMSAVTSASTTKQRPATHPFYSNRLNNSAPYSLTNVTSEINVHIDTRSWLFRMELLSSRKETGLWRIKKNFVVKTQNNAPLCYSFIESLVQQF